MIVRAHARSLLLELMRLPSFTISAVAAPVLFFAFFGLPAADSTLIANSLLIGYMAFAFLGVLLFDFGVSVAVERDSQWERYIRTLPATGRHRLAARVLVGFSVALLASGTTAVVIVLTTPVRLHALDWLGLALSLVGGSLPFAFLGLAIGYWAPAQAASPVASLLFLPLAYVGGLWTSPHELPTVAERLSPLTPTRAWYEVLEAGSEMRFEAAWLLGVAAWAVLFGFIAFAGYRRTTYRAT